MISSLQGTVSHLGQDRLTLVVSGVGFSIQVTSRHAAKLSVGQEFLIQTKLVVREDDLSLFGFQTGQEAELFDLLCGVNGIGPKLAMTTLSGLTGELLVNAINSQDESAFRAITRHRAKDSKTRADHPEWQGRAFIECQRQRKRAAGNAAIGVEMNSRQEGFFQAWISHCLNPHCSSRLWRSLVVRS